MSAIDALIERILIAVQSVSPFVVGKVVTVVQGAAVDGNALVTVSAMGRNLNASYGAHYTPTVNDVVLMARTQPLVILLRIIGTPA